MSSNLACVTSSCRASSTKVEIDVIVIIILILHHVFITSRVLMLIRPVLVIVIGVGWLDLRGWRSCGYGGRRRLGSVVIVVTWRVSA